MGKSTLAGMFRALGVPVFDADAAVHAIYRGETARAVEAAFPGVAPDGVVDRGRLGARVAGDPAALKRLEAIVHPAVAALRAKFLDDARARGARIAILDIPLLFETGGDRAVDVVVVVSAAALRSSAPARYLVPAPTPRVSRRCLRVRRRMWKSAAARISSSTPAARLASSRRQAEDVLRALAGA